MIETPNANPLPISPRVLSALRALLAGLSVLMALGFLVTALKRLHFPFEYDWIEDGVLASVRHIRSGLPLYQQPSVRFTPYLYTPIYLYAAAALSKITGLGYYTLRLLSIFATLGCFGALYALVYTELRRHLPALAAVGFFAACYPAVQGAFDVGRVDMLYLFFVLCAFYATRYLNPTFAALLWVCAFQTKQGVLPIALLALSFDWQRPRRVLLGLATFIVALGGSVLWLTHATDGWYRYYVFGMAGGFGYAIPQTVRFIPVDMIGVGGIALLIIVAAMCFAPPALRSPAFSFYTLGSLGMIAFTAYIRAHRGSNVNALLPMYAWIAVLFGLALARLASVLEEHASIATNAALATLWLAASMQLITHYYSPNEFIPQPETLAHRIAFEQQVRSIQGDVLIIGHPEDGLLAGKSLYAGSESIGAVIDAKNRAVGDALISQYNVLLHNGTLHAVALDIPAEEMLAISRSWIPRDFLALYPLRIDAIGGTETHLGSGPRFLYMPCNAIDDAKRLDPRLDATPCAPTNP